MRPSLRARPHTYPWRLGYSFDNPLRRFVHNPLAVFGGLVGERRTVADIGCGLGYFRLALAEMVGPRGTVIALDLQPQMIRRARRRAARRGLRERIDSRVCSPNHLGLTERVDFALAFWMLHEVGDPRGLLTEVWSSLRPSGQLLIVEPKVHVRAGYSGHHQFPFSDLNNLQIADLLSAFLEEKGLN